jgi:MYXO-CTERM domain-containing protein
MKCSFVASVAQPVDRIWSAFADVDRALAALPGTTLVRAGDAVSGTVKCTVGTAQITYRLSALAEIRETEPHTAVIAVTGKEARGPGTLAATLTLALRADGPSTTVEVSGDIQASGRGESADEQAWSRVIGRLVDSAMPTLAASAAVAAPSLGPASPLSSAPPLSPAPPRPALAGASAGVDSDVAGPSRAGPSPQTIAGVAVVGLLLVLRRRRKHRRANGGSQDD